MNDTVLLAYTTAAGSTAEVAQVIAHEISSHKGNVEVIKAKEVIDLSHYSAVILGTGIRACGCFF